MWIEDDWLLSGINDRSVEHKINQIDVMLGQRFIDCLRLNDVIVTNEPQNPPRTFEWFPPGGPFGSDPHGVEAWLWAIFPLLLLALLVTIALVAPGWYLTRVQPEGYGWLELSHFTVPAITSIIAIALLSHVRTRSEPVLLAWTAMLALGCFYIAGEEHSWGQHFFDWSTPDVWRELNTQDETNLHNVSDVFGKLPRTLLTTGIVLMGFVYPLCVQVWPALNKWNPIAICMPPLPLLPTAFCVIVVIIADQLEFMSWLGQPGVRLSEVSETFIYLFLLFGVIILRRRIIELEHNNDRS